MTSMHYGAPSSLPSDYAILSRYAHSRENADVDDDHDHDIYDLDESTDTQDDMNADGRVMRRAILPSSYAIPMRPNISQPFNPTTFVSGDEYTPLLVPHIGEDVDTNTDPIYPQSTSQVYIDEFRILIKYTLPVFWYTSPFRTVTVTLSLT